MKEELIKALNVKIKYVEDNIYALNKITDNLAKENKKLDYINGILDIFKDDDDKYNIYHFAELSKEEFEEVLKNELPPYISDKFSTNSCNYDGLTYLINGINTGISLSLNDEQVSAIEDFISSLDDTRLNYMATIDGIEMAKDRLEISDIDELTRIKDQYEKIVRKLENNEYVTEVEEINSALIFSRYDNNKIVDILSYILTYNADIYVTGKEEVKEEVPSFTSVETDIIPEEKEEVPEELKEEVEVEEKKEPEEIEETKEEDVDWDFYNFLNEKVDVETILNDIDKKEYDVVKEQISSLDEEKEEVKEEATEEKKEEGIDINAIINNDEEEKDIPFSIPVANEEEDSDIDLPEADDDDLGLPEVEDELPEAEEDELPEAEEEPEVEQEKEEVEAPFVVPFVDTPSMEIEDHNEYQEEATFDVPTFEENEIEVETPQEIEVEAPKEVEQPQEEIEVKEEVPEENTNKLDYAEVKKLLDEYKLNLDGEKLTSGDLDNYREILDLLKDKEIINQFNKNEDLFINTLLHSDIKAINEVLGVVKHDLSIDNNDYRDTLAITIETMPTIFIKEPYGNYECFSENVKLMKKWNIDLINLFDFSRELLIVNHNLIMENYETLGLYNLKLNEKNAKYYLGLTNLREKLDYYIEAVYKDTMKGGTGKTFDGIDFINNYPNKINVVTDLTIKRLRYSSENGLKLFSKENKLASEITNLRVDAINIPEDVMSNYFDNSFEGIDVAKYEKIIRNAKNVNILKDELLSKFEKYHHKNRYIIDNINISYNKVLYNYNALINEGVDKGNALLFAFCHNLVITKSEYNSLREFIKNRGGI